MSARDDDLPPGPAAIELSEAERLLLSSIRLWVTARMFRKDPMATLVSNAPRCLPPAAVSTVIRLMHGLEVNATRPLCIRPVGCPGVYPDELRLVSACGLSRISLELAADRLEGLTTSASLIAILLRQVNDRYARAGFSFPLRLAPAGPEPDAGPAAAQPTVH